MKVLIVLSLLINDILSERGCYPSDECFANRITTWDGNVLEYANSYECQYSDTNNEWSTYQIDYNDTDCVSDTDERLLRTSDGTCESECTDYVLWTQWDVEWNNTECDTYEDEDYQTVIQWLGCKSGNTSVEYVCNDTFVTRYEFYTPDCSGDPWDIITLEDGCNEVFYQVYGNDYSYVVYVDMLYCDGVSVVDDSITSTEAVIATEVETTVVIDTTMATEGDTEATTESEGGEDNANALSIFHCVLFVSVIIIFY